MAGTKCPVCIFSAGEVHRVLYVQSVSRKNTSLTYHPFCPIFALYVVGCELPVVISNEYVQYNIIYIVQNELHISN